MKPKTRKAPAKRTTVPAVVEPKAPVQVNPEIVTNLVLKGDLSAMTPVQRVDYYRAFCEHLGLNPLTKPFDLLNLSGKLVLYANKGAAEQLRGIYGVSVTELRGEIVGDCYRVTAVGHDKTGRTDAATGVVAIGGKHGDDLANATMKAETKAKRRLTLSICGLNMLDETEVETIRGAEKVEVDMTNTLKASIDQVQRDGKPVPPEPPVYDVGGSETTGEWKPVLDGDGNPAKAPQVYWKNRDPGHRQTVLAGAFGPAIAYDVRKDDEGWHVWRKVGEVAAAPVGKDIPF